MGVAHLGARNLVRQFHKLRDAAGLPWLRCHDLRHGVGSLLEHRACIPAWRWSCLGHSQISLTMQVYTHVAPELAKEAAAKIDAALGG